MRSCPWIPQWLLPAFTFCLLSGCVLDNEEIVDTLQKSKLTANEISKRISETEKAEREIQATRKNYLPIATRGALLYFLVADLAQVSHMYQFSLDWFRQVFLSSAVIKSKEQEEHGSNWEKTSLQKVHELTSLSKEPRLKLEKHPLERHLENSIDALTMNIFKVATVCEADAAHAVCSRRVRLTVPLSPVGGLRSPLQPAQTVLRLPALHHHHEAQHQRESARVPPGGGVEHLPLLEHLDKHRRGDAAPSS